MPEVKTCAFDARRDTEFASQAPGFDHVMHIFNDGWHGIRAASGYCPGRKLALSFEDGLDGEALRHIEGLIHHHRINRIVFQGYSEIAGDLACLLKKNFAEEVAIHAITHVTSAQFENMFELEMQGLIHQHLNEGVLTRVGSVKPDFASVFGACWPQTILNFAPTLKGVEGSLAFEKGSVFVPIENTWRKNLYTNMLAALSVDRATRIHVVNHPTGLDMIADLDRVVVEPYRKRAPLLAFMATMEVQMNVTLAECQPMTQLEALAVGTPCLTGPLLLEEFAGDPVVDLCEVAGVDNPRLVAAALDRVIDARRSDPAGLRQMIDDHLARRTELAIQRYAEFLDL